MPRETPTSIRRILIYFGLIAVAVGTVNLAYASDTAARWRALVPLAFGGVYLYGASTLRAKLPTGAKFVCWALRAGLATAVVNGLTAIWLAPGFESIVKLVLSSLVPLYLFVNVRRLVREAPPPGLTRSEVRS